MLTPMRQHYLIAADAAARLLSDPLVAQCWTEPSALAEFRVSGLAGHLSKQILYVPEVLALPEPSDGVITVDEHYARAAWVTAPVDAESNVITRERGEQAAADGAGAVADRAMASVAELQTTLQTTLESRVVSLPWAGTALSLDDFLLTRLMELVVHSDDLAVSVGVPTPVLPAETLAPVVELLSRLALRRHGGLPMVRALARAERAPESIAAF